VIGAWLSSVTVAALLKCWMRSFAHEILAAVILLKTCQREREREREQQSSTILLSLGHPVEFTIPHSV